MRYLTTKRSHYFRNFAHRTLHVALCIILFSSLLSCGNRENPPADNNTGSLAFSLVLETPSAAPSQKAGIYRAKTGDICIDYALSVIYGRVLNPGSSEVATAQWPCSAHQGVISNIPAGTGMTLVVEGSAEGSSAVEWRGQATGIEIKPGKTTNAPPVPIAPVPEITSDATPPAVTTKNPDSGAASVPVTSKITINFSKKMAAYTIDATSFTVKRSDTSGSIAGTISYPSPNTATFTPAGTLAYSTGYTVILTTAIKDLSEQRGLSNEVTWSFTTESQQGGGTTTTPQPPANVVATAASATEISLSWSQSAGAVSYYVFRDGSFILEVPSPSTSISSTGLSPSTTYCYTVNARDAADNLSQASQQACATTLQGPAPAPSAPSAPTGVSASPGPGSGENTITWNAVSGATSYNIYWSTTSGVTRYSPNTIMAITNNIFTHLSLAGGTTYYYVVTAVNNYGESAESVQVQATVPSSQTDTSPPTAPAYLTATAVSESQISLTWAASTDDKGVTSYKIFRYGAFLKSVTGTSTSDSGLASSTQYCYTVKAADAATNESPSSTQACATTNGAAAPAPAVPDAPAGVSASSGSGQNTITWNAVSGATSYSVYWSTASGVNKFSSKISAIDSNSYTHTALSNGTTYYYIVTAVNISGESAQSIEVSATPVSPPPTPTGVVATAENGQNLISWSSVTGATSYNIYWATWQMAAKEDGIKITVTSTGNPYTHVGLTNDTVYYYLVTASNAYGESGWTEQASATPSASILPKPTGVTASAGNEQTTISWTAVTDAASYNIYWSTTSGVTTGTGTKVPDAVSPYVHTGRVNGTTYYYIVTAVDAGSNEGAASTETSATPNNNPPPMP